MYTAKKNGSGRQRLNVWLAAPLGKKFDEYCIALMSHKGFINDVKPKIVRAALEEFLKNHEEDFDVKF